MKGSPPVVLIQRFAAIGPLKENGVARDASVYVSAAASLTLSSVVHGPTGTNPPTSPPVHWLTDRLQIPPTGTCASSSPASLLAGAVSERRWSPSRYTGSGARPRIGQLLLVCQVPPS